MFFLILQWICKVEKNILISKVSNVLNLSRVAYKPASVDYLQEFLELDMLT